MDDPNAVNGYAVGDSNIHNRHAAAGAKGGVGLVGRVKGPWSDGNSKSHGVIGNANVNLESDTETEGEGDSDERHDCGPSSPGCEAAHIVEAGRRSPRQVNGLDLAPDVEGMKQVEGTVFNLTPEQEMTYTVGMARADTALPSHNAAATAEHDEASSAKEQRSGEGFSGGGGAERMQDGNVGESGVATLDVEAPAAERRRSGSPGSGPASIKMPRTAGTNQKIGSTTIEPVAAWSSFGMGAGSALDALDNEAVGALVTEIDAQGKVGLHSEENAELVASGAEPNVSDCTGDCDGCLSGNGGDVEPISVDSMGYSGLAEAAIDVDGPGESASAGKSSDAEPRGLDSFMDALPPGFVKCPGCPMVRRAFDGMYVCINAYLGGLCCEANSIVVSVGCMYQICGDMC